MGYYVRHYHSPSDFPISNPFYLQEVSSRNPLFKYCGNTSSACKSLFLPKHQYRRPLTKYAHVHLALGPPARAPGGIGKSRDIGDQQHGFAAGTKHAVVFLEHVAIERADLRGRAE